MRLAGGKPAFSLVLHTWTKELVVHLHVHAVMACGVLVKDGSWSAPARKADFLFPLRALSAVFRGKFLAALTKGHQEGSIKDDPQGARDGWAQRRFMQHIVSTGLKRIRHYGALASACKGER